MNEDKKFSDSDMNAWRLWEGAASEAVPFHLSSVNDDWMEDTLYVTKHGDDMVNSPAHYTKGKYEAIDVIEDAILNAPTVMDGFLQGQALKYLLRLWHKIDAKEDAEKARWYLNRLIDSLN